jgi:glutamate dehydrogenase/leucine dehydrogenase
MHIWLQVKNSSGILELPCDVLIPAALESQIHSGNAANIKVILEVCVFITLDFVGCLV